MTHITLNVFTVWKKQQSLFILKQWSNITYMANLPHVFLGAFAARMETPGGEVQKNPIDSKNWTSPSIIQEDISPPSLI